MSGTQGLGPSFDAALAQARASGQPVPIPNPDGSPSSLMALPNGTMGTIGGGFGGVARTGLPVPPIPPATQPALAQPVAPSAPGSAAGVPGLPGSPSGAAIAPPQQPSWWQQMLAPNSGVDLGLNYGTPVATINVHAPPVLNQANPAFTAGIQGAVGTQSGPPVHATYDMPPAPVVAAQAQRYRQAHGLATPDDSAATDALNAASLAAARAGRTFMQPGPYPASGNIVANALIAPPGGAVGGRAVLTPNGVVPGAFGDPSSTQQLAQNLLSQGVY